ncbi:MAG: alpha/beta fold hydrolase [Candidatus Marsarchaeota archaeon]|nr:alpha/beta fold hydrolase [Candidatus Marsarchaeota archaeon]
MKFVIFHGSYGSSEGNWFPDLKEKLESLGQDVIAVQFPVDSYDEVEKAGESHKASNQTLEAWMATFKNKVYGKLKKNEKLCFIGHSLGCAFILHVLEKYRIKLDSAIFVSPFLKPLHIWQFDIVNKTFYKSNFDWDELRRLVPISYVIYSETDPYISVQQFFEFAEKMRSSLIPVKRAGHLNREVNLNEFPLVCELCKSRIDLSIYQRYLEHRRELYSIPYVKGKAEEEIYIDPKEVVDEGIFHFSNLRRGGFCTFYTAPNYFEPHSVYMETARRAAQRVPLTRVFVVNKSSDLKRQSVIEQIKSDLSAGIKVYLCRWREIRRNVKEPDWGLWDGEYLCTVHYDKKNKVSEVKLSSRKSDLTTARKWEAEILKKAMRVNDIEEVKRLSP